MKTEIKEEALTEAELEKRNKMLAEFIGLKEKYTYTKNPLSSAKKERTYYYEIPKSMRYEFPLNFYWVEPRTQGVSKAYTVNFHQDWNKLMIIKKKLEEDGFTVKSKTGEGWNIYNEAFLSDKKNGISITRNCESDILSLFRAICGVIKEINNKQPKSKVDGGKS